MDTEIPQTISTFMELLNLKFTNWDLDATYTVSWSSLGIYK